MRKEFCGLFGVWNMPQAAEKVFLGLYSLQHRGQESAGIVSCLKHEFFSKKGMGLVNEVFDAEDMRRLRGSSAIGHVRYSTSGSSSFGNIQPIIVHYQNSPIAIAHNGNIPSAVKWREKLEKEGIIFSTETDSELILKMLVREEGTWEERLKKVLDRLKGAFSLILFFPEKIIAVRDSYGFRPLSLGRKEDSAVISSETCAFDIIDAEHERDIEPGEILVIDENGERSLSLEPRPHRPCIFELIYFSRPDSQVFSQSVYQTRLNMGWELAREKKIKADLVMSVPDSANMQAMGYSKKSGIPLETGLMRSHYIGRTFIEPHQDIRDFRVKIKFSPVGQLLKGKRVIVIDDSIVRGTTSKKLVNMIRKAGAREIHFLVASPPIKHSCYYGIDTPTDSELIANHLSVDEIAEYLGVDTLQYLSMDGLLRACKKTDYCLSCFNNDYPLRENKNE